MVEQAPSDPAPSERAAGSPDQGNTDPGGTELESTELESTELRTPGGMGTATDPPPATDGPRRLLSVVYGIFALAATARAGVQLATQFDDAPLAYSLSLFSGFVYIAATVGLVSRQPWSRRLTWAAVVIELVGVLTIGTASLIDPGAFPHDTVWSKFGYGYVFIPVILPLAGLWWLFSSRDQDRRSSRIR